jgi:hypothetical protein
MPMKLPSDVKISDDIYWDSLDAAVHMVIRALGFVANRPEETRESDEDNLVRAIDQISKIKSRMCAAASHE